VKTEKENETKRCSGTKSWKEKKNDMKRIRKEMGGGRRGWAW